MNGRMERRGKRGGEKERWRKRERETKNVSWFPDKAVRVPNPLRLSKTLCEVERLEVLSHSRIPSIWNQRENVFNF